MINVCAYVCTFVTLNVKCVRKKGDGERKEINDYKTDLQGFRNGLMKRQETGEKNTYRTQAKATYIYKSVV